MYMRLKDGKQKVFTLSYDDGVVQDIRLVQLLDKYGVKGTFNLNSGKYFPEDAQRERYYGRMKRSEAVELFKQSRHEVALHGYAHRDMPQLSPQDILQEIREDRLIAERDYGRLIRGMAYAFGAYNEDVLTALKLCGICYSRTTVSTCKFRFPENWLTWHPTCHHNNPKTLELAQRFVAMKNGEAEGAKLFYVWGHSYEFDNDDNWDRIETLLETVGGKSDIWYATNIEVYDYVQAYRSLQASMDGRVVHNPSAIAVWFSDGEKTHCITSGETLYI